MSVVFQADKLDDEVKDLWGKAQVKPGEKTPKDIEALEPEKKDEKPPEDKPPEEKNIEEPPKPDEKPPEEPVKEPPKEDEWKHKYDVLKGKYDAEVPRLAFELAESNKKNSDLEKRVSALESKPKEEKPPEPKPLTPSLKKLKEEYPDIFDAVSDLNKSSIEEAVSKVAEKVTAKVDKTVEQVTQTVVKSDRQRYIEGLDGDQEIGKEWRGINEDPEFEKWVQQEDEYSGIPRASLLRDAWDRMDRNRTLKFFKNFKKEKTGSDTPKNVDPKDNPKEDKKTVKKPDIAPPRGGGGGSPTEDKKGDTVTIEDVTNHLQEIADGKWTGKEAEAEAKTKKLHEALFNKKKKA